MSRGVGALAAVVTMTGVLAMAQTAQKTTSSLPVKYEELTAPEFVKAVGK